MATSIPPQFRHAVITASLRCQKCGYDLQGLQVEGKCPECGMANGESIVFAVDPDASRLPRLGDERRVGDAVLWLSVCMLMATLFVSMRALLLRIGAFVPVWDVVPPALGHYASLIGGAWAALGLIGCVILAPPRDCQPSSVIWRDIGLLTAGLLLFAVLAAVRWTGETGRLAIVSGQPGLSRGILHVALGIAAIVALLGLRNVFAIIGQRSREWRSAKGGRQRVLDMIWAVLGIVVGEILRAIAVALDLDTLHAMGAVLIWICNFMLVIGLIYLVVNAGWMRGALRRPRPTYDQVLLPPLPDDATLADVDFEEDFEVYGREPAEGGEGGQTSAPG